MRPITIIDLLRLRDYAQSYVMRWGGHGYPSPITSFDQDEANRQFADYMRSHTPDIKAPEASLLFSPAGMRPIPQVLYRGGDGISIDLVVIDRSDYVGVVGVDQ